MSTIQEKFSELTKDQQYILSVLYKNYLQCVNSGSIKIQCNNFDDALNIHTLYFSQFHFEDIESDLMKLNKANFIQGIVADGTINFIQISDSTISYFENEFKNNMKSILDNISKISSFIPGL